MREIDLKNPKSNRGNAGFSDEERGKFTGAAQRRVYRYLARGKPRRRGRLQLVELPL